MKDITHFENPHFKAASQPLNEQELSKAFALWLAYWDQFLADELEIYGSQGQIRKARLMQRLSGETLGKRLQISRSAYFQIEKREKNMQISLPLLCRVAEALECELQYRFVPRNGLSFAELAWSKLLPTAMSHKWLNHCDPKKRPEALVGIMKRFWKS